MAKSPTRIAVFAFEGMRSRIKLSISRIEGNLYANLLFDLYTQNVD